MITTVSITPDVVRRLEEIEAEAWGDLFLSASNEAAAACGIKFIHVGSGCATIASNIDILSFNRVVGLGLNTPADGAMVDDLIRAYALAEIPRFFVQLSPEASPDYLSEILIERGFSHYNNWVKLYRGVESPPAASSELRVERISVNEATAFAEVFVTSFEWPQKLIPWIAHTVGRPGWRHYLAFDGDKPVATGALYAQGDYSWLDFASTLPEYRNRGAQSALVERRIRDAVELGCKRLVVETAQETPERPAPSYRNMLRFGFQVAYVRPNYLFSR